MISGALKPGPHVVNPDLHHVGHDARERRLPLTPRVGLHPSLHFSPGRGGLATLSRLDLAVEDLQTAASICDTNGARGCAVQARVELAAALTRRQAPGDRNGALAALATAARETGPLGMVPFTEWIEQLQAQLAATLAGDSPLSPRELEVARLVAQGLANKQIGQTLYVSERTAENHVQHILVKLGLRNRSQGPYGPVDS
jgi:DNA-binding NarL/FixJ family response regulator